MKYAKIENNRLEYAPKNKDGILNWDKNEELVLEAGYLPIGEKQPSKNQYQDGYEIIDSVIYPKYVDRIITYIDERKSEYPSIEDQLDMLYWDKINDTNIWFETISAIKAKYPKE